MRNVLVFVLWLLSIIDHIVRLVKTMRSNESSPLKLAHIPQLFSPLTGPTMQQPNQKHNPSNTSHPLAPLFFSFLLHLIIPATSKQPAYWPTDNIALNCGSSGDGEYQTRSWIGDINDPNNPITKISQTSFPSDANPPPTLLPNIPYSTARVSTSEFTYSFPVTAGPKFIRLYFYPADYQSFTRADAFFAVKSGPYTLLNNFSAALVVDSPPNTQGFVREFSLPIVDDQVLNITFTPSTTHPNSYAFINGVEIVSMPDELYFSPILDSPNGIKYVGQNSMFSTSDIHALELIGRLKVGGNGISPSDDTGMYRQWEIDNDYLTSDFKGFVPSFPGDTLDFEKIPNYTAPNDVYRTSRTMGPNKIINSLNNLTWTFQVDNNFSYLVRLHFCELQPGIVEAIDRVFQIYIDTKLGEPYASIIGWSGGNGKPVYRDFVVPMYHQSGNKRINLSIDLHPNSLDLTRYVDSSLSGIELFKLAGIDNNLAGPNPDPVSSPPSFEIPPPKHKVNEGLNQKTIASIATGSVFGLAVILVLLGFFLYRIKGKGVKVKGFDSHATTATSTMTLTSSSYAYATTAKSTMTLTSLLPFDLCRRFSLVEIKAATKNFNDVFIIGVGGFGTVYEGYINGSSTLAAIKRLNPDSRQGKHEFLTEIEMLSQLRHLHIVSLIGYCYDQGEMILIYDYMARGTLRDHLYNTTNPPLPWKKRLRICMGAARGLDYLHTGAKHTIIHRDMKTTNILLDENWEAKVSDFGLSRVGPTSASRAHVSTVVKGTFGYLDPEYYRRQQLTEKSDVYSFGVVLFEVLSARPAVDKKAERSEISLAQWAKICCRNGTIDQFIDPHLTGKIAPKCLKKFCEIALSCLDDVGIKRPSMQDIVWGLEFALQLQESAEQGDNDAAERVQELEYKQDSEEVPIKGLAVGQGDEVFSTSDAKSSSRMTASGVGVDDEQSSTSYDSDKFSSGAVFSELKNAKGR